MTLDVRQLTRAVTTLADPSGPVARAAARALNRAVVSGRAVMARDIAQDMGLPVNTVRDAIIVENATPTTLVARLSVTGARIPLIDFGASGPEPSRGRGAGVRSRMKGGPGIYPHAFIATMASGHRGVFERTGRARLKIHELRGASLPHVFRKYIPDGQARAQEALESNLTSELNFELRQVNRTA